jgi:hypothetical protein
LHRFASIRGTLARHLPTPTPIPLLDLLSRRSLPPPSAGAVPSSSPGLSPRNLAASPGPTRSRPSPSPSEPASTTPPLPCPCQPFIKGKAAARAPPSHHVTGSAVQLPFPLFVLLHAARPPSRRTVGCCCCKTCALEERAGAPPLELRHRAPGPFSLMQSRSRRKKTECHIHDALPCSTSSSRFPLSLSRMCYDVEKST